MVDGNRNDLLVMEEFESLEQAQSFMQSDDLRNAMHHAGVVGRPDVLMVEGVEEGTA